MFSGMQASVEKYISNSLLMMGYHKFFFELAKLLYSMSSQFEAESEKIKNILSLFMYSSLVFLLISNLISWLRLHQFLGTNNTEANKFLKTDANGANK